MKTLISATLAAAAALASPAWAQSAASVASRADCALRIESGATNWIIQGYDPFATNVPIATYDVVFNNEVGAACTFDPVFTVDQEPFGLALDGRAGRVPYTL